MSDPLDELRNLGGAAAPGRLDPVEVRRRGDRMRLRRTVLQAVTAAAAVAVIASGGAVVAGNLTSTGPQPAPAPAPTGSADPSPTPSYEPPEGGWVTTIPEGFPVDRGLPAAGGDVPEWEWSQEVDTPLTALACGETEPLPMAPVDALRVQVDPPDERAWRHLILFEDEAATSSVIDHAASADGRCMAALQGDQVGAAAGPEEMRWSLEMSARGEASVVEIEGRAYARGTETRVPGRSLTWVVQVGNAVFIAHHSDASSATGADSTTRAFASHVDEIVEAMCVFSAGGCGGEPEDDAVQPDDLEPAPLPYAITAETLEEHTGQDGWTPTQGIVDPPMVCAEESTEALAGNRTDTRQYGLFDDEGFTVGMATTTVLDFSLSSEAPDGFERAADWLITCDEPLDRDHRIFSAGDAYGDVHSGSWTTGPWRWRTVMSSAPEVCEECDAAWNHHQGLALGGERLVIVQVSTRGDLQQSADEADSPMPGLLEAAAALAAGSRTGPATEPFGPAGVRGLELGMRTGEAPDRSRVRIVGGSSGCQAFLLRGPGRPANNIDGFIERGLGVAVVFARLGMATPEGVGLGSSRDEVLAAHPGGQDVVAGYRVDVPGRADRHFLFGFEDGRVSSLLLALDDQSCWD